MVVAIIATAFLVGLVPGLLLFEWLASPFGPGLWKLATPFARVFLTVSQFLRGRGVLVKLKTGEYEIGTYVPDADGGPAVQVAGRQIPVDPDKIRWGLFGKKPFGVTWEPGTDFHRRVRDESAEATDGGGYPIDMAAAHRYLEGTNDADAINRTEEHAKAEYGGGSDGISDKVMAGLIILMLLMGTGTAFFMVG